MIHEFWDWYALECAPSAVVWTSHRGQGMPGRERKGERDTAAAETG